MTKALLKLAFLPVALVLLCTGAAFSAQILIGQPLVIIDPGHHKKNPGIRNGSGLEESAITLKLARLLEDFLSDTCRVRLARTSDGTNSEPSPAALANREKANLFLSLHLHSNTSAQPSVFFFDTPEAAGTDTWQTRALGSQAESKKLAGIVADAIKADEPGTHPIVLSGPMLPLEGLNMPGILVEPFALSQTPDTPEEQRLFLEARARSMADAVLAFLADKRSGN